MELENLGPDLFDRRLYTCDLVRVEVDYHDDVAGITTFVTCFPKTDRWIKRIWRWILARE